MASNEINTELESFREQWRAEVRAKVPGPKSETQYQPQSGTNVGPSNIAKTTRRASRAAELPRVLGKKLVQHDEVEDEYHRTQSFDEPAPVPILGDGNDVKGKGKEDEVEREPVSALEHYEKAVERELAGKLGDSLSLYRKAFRVSPSHVVLLG
jgi:F-box protein 9